MLNEDTGSIDIRPAERQHLPDIIAMLADDELGARREDTSAEARADYERAFDAITAHPSTELYVALLGDKAVGTFQLTFIPSLSQRGMIRVDVEAVRVHSSLRGKGLGAKIMEFAVEQARRGGAGMIQLTSNKLRPDAHRFYERLGFARSHEGFKLKL